jgi:hypothetical protein
MPRSKTFCILPWMHVATSPGGVYRVCCNSDSKNNKLTLNGEPLRMRLHPHTLLHHSEVLLDVRQKMLDGEWADTCKRCKIQEAAGAKSSRQAYNMAWDRGQSVALHDPIVPRYIDLRLGNMCNLKCRMCNPYSSNQWLAEWEQIHGPFEKTEHEWLTNIPWPQALESIQHLQDMIPYVEEIYFTGGEPTIIKQHMQLLDYCIQHDYAKNITLKYNTNLTNVPVRLINRWNQFKYLRLNCSIDGIGKLNDYIRYPSKWSAIWKNYNKMLTTTQNRSLDIHVTVQVTNILKLHQLLERFVRPLAQVNETIPPFVFFNLLHEPDYLNIKVLPSDLKQIALERLQPWLGHPDLASLPAVLEYMMKDDQSDKWGEFVNHTHQLDGMRGQDILTVVPEFRGWL